MGPAPDDYENDPPRELTSYFDASVRSVHASIVRFENRYLCPLYKKSNDFFLENPIVSVFIALFCCLSILPAAAFLIACILTIATFSVLAAACAFVASSIVVLSLFVILSSILVATFLSSIVLTGTLISAYLFFRLVFLVRKDGSSGLSSWLSETKGHVLKAARRTSHVKHRSMSGGSSEYGVIVNNVKGEPSNAQAHSTGFSY